MIRIIKNINELEKFIHENGDYDSELTYILKEKDNDECYAIFGCSCASEAWENTRGQHLIVSDREEDFEQVLTQIKNADGEPFYIEDLADMLPN